MIEFQQAEVEQYYSLRVPGLKRSGAESRGPCPIHDGKDPNFSVNLATGLATCHSQCGRGWDIISLEQSLTNSDFQTAKANVFRTVGRAEPAWEDRDIEATYDYQREDGTVAYQVVRRSGKKFSQRRPDGNGGWQWGLAGATPLPFRLPNVLKAHFVAIVEGEKDVLRLDRESITATTNSGGAGNFKPEMASWFTGKKVGIFPDNDEPGRQHALKVAALLSGVALSVRVVELPGLPPKGDISDFLATGGTVQQIRDCYTRAQEWTPEWHFAIDVPNENDKYVRTLIDEISAAGGTEKFWDFSLRPGVPTPWNSLTRALGGGMRNGEVYVIGANQGSGKTSLALQFGTKALRSRLGVLMYSMEMGWRDVFQRMVAMEARVDLLEFQEFQRMGGDTSDMRQRLSLAQSELMNYPLLVSTKTRVTPEYLVEETIRLKSRQPIHFVIVDHMQLMGTTNSVRGDYEKFTAISRAMKDTAREVDVPVLLVSQTSRSNSSDKREELEVSDLRGSGAIEEDAAAVMLVYPDRKDSERAKQDRTFTRGPVVTWLKVGKNRYGLSGAYTLLQHAKRFTRFDLYEGDYESA